MMSTPTLSKKQQQKKSFSVKKTPVKGLRNVLSQPYDFFWPILRDDNNGENINELKTLLEESMSATKRPSLGIPWSHLHKLKKDERRSAREEARSNLKSAMPDQNILNSIVVGINGVTRLLEKNDAACVLLEANVEPMILIKHIVSMAESNEVPVILVNILKNVTLESIGFASAAVALKKNITRSENHHFNKLYRKIVELSKNFDEKRTTLKLEYEKSIDEDSSTADEIPMSNLDKKKKRNDDSFEISSDVYLYRNSREERIFVPENAKSEIDGGMFEDVDFISIGKDSDSANDDESIEMSKTKTRYVDIREKVRRKPREAKDEASLPTKFISLNTNAKFSASSIDDDSLYEKKTKILGLSDDNSRHSETTKKSSEVKKNRNDKTKYHSLRVKRIQGNFKRAKATKVSKSNKK